MAFLIDTRTGPVIQADGAGDQPLRQSRMGSLVVVDGHARYWEPSSRGQTFLAANQAGLALSALSATATGFILSNPAGSGKNLSILHIGVHFTAVLAGSAVIVLAANVNPIAAATVHTTPLIVRPTLLGGSGLAVGLADSAATLPVAPVVIRVLLSGVGAAPATATVSPPILDDVAGQIVMAPGTTVSIQGTAAVAGAICDMVWEEIVL